MKIVFQKIHRHSCRRNASSTKKTGAELGITVENRGHGLSGENENRACEMVCSEVAVVYQKRETVKLRRHGTRTAEKTRHNFQELAFEMWWW